MTRTCLIVLAPVAIAFAFVQQPAAGQALSKKYITDDGKRPNGLFAPGVMVGKTLYISGRWTAGPRDGEEPR